MKSSGVYDALIGFFLTAIVAAGYILPGFLPVFEGLELKAFDRRSKLRQSLDPAQEIAIVAVDDASIAAVGRWPWPRSRVAGLIDKLAGAGPRVIGLDIVYSENEQNMGLVELEALQREYDALVASRKVVDKSGEFKLLVTSAAVRLDSDAKLKASLEQARNVVLPLFFANAPVIGAKPEPLPPSISSWSVSAAVSVDSDLAPREGVKAVFPIEIFAAPSAGVGHVNVDPDFDGVVRRESPVVRYASSYVPSFALQLVLAYSGLKPTDAQLVPGHHIRIGGKEIPLDADSQMLTTFNGPDQTFRYYSFQDVMSDRVSPDAFKDRIVLVGLTATAVGTLYVTPVAHNFPAVEMVANVIENILHEKFLVRPPWAAQLEWSLIAVVALFIMLGLPRLRALWGFLVSALLLGGLVGAGTYLFINGQWVKIAYPASLLSLGYLVIVSKRFFVTEKGKELVEASAIETNKMLGLSFQGQGMLDMAFEKFRLCPLDPNLKDTLYNLSLDFERKRQFAKAASVLDHIAAKDPKYKDVVEKAAKLKQASEGAVFGGIGGAKKEGTVMITGGAAKPTLGRYEIEKELGRGAMGIVYLGKDPKINRQVAIKTMMLEEGSDSAEAKAVKERFFREAESAGTLNHPNIVRIFDAGEEQDIAYIAMELLDGHEFTQYTAKGALLPIDKVVDHVATVAEALDYAHDKGIVHRDIKPANIMMLKDGTIRVADFGIARITTSSKTATGTVMGTPSYMSPEQVAGKKVDGRSDLFSLTVTLYELLVGEKPFKGGEGIGTLLFQIANDPHPDPRALRADLPAGLVPVINKGLAKNPDERYPRGAALAAALRAALKDGSAPAGGSPPPPPPASKPEPVAENATAEVALASAAGDLLADLKAAETPAGDVTLPGAGEATLVIEPSSKPPAQVLSAEEPAAPAPQSGGLTIQLPPPEVK
jgi:eukaryotic-like serine/threonine-protein kinase